MIPFLLDLTFRGTLVTIVVLVLDWLLTQKMQPRLRRAWWILAALAWLLPLRLPEIPREFSLPLPSISKGAEVLRVFPASAASKTTSTVRSFDMRWIEIIGAVWITGTIGGLFVIVVRTIQTTRRWSGKRLCSNSELIDLLEDCKSDAGVTAPIVLVLTSSVSTPILLGCLRPRILLPQVLVDSVSRKQLRSILLHELAHFRSADIPINWLFGFAMAIHWFNPFVYLASRRWRIYCEIAADAAALRWMRPDARVDYGEALIIALGQTHETSIPQGALALGESFESLKERIRLVGSGGGRARMATLVAMVSVILAVFVAMPSQATEVLATDPIEAKSLASTAAFKWLKVIDDGSSNESWDTASQNFKTFFTLDQWGRNCAMITAWGKCESRRLVAANYDPKVKGANGEPVELVTVKYESSFAKLGARLERVSVVKESDGQWRVFSMFVSAK